MPSHYFFRREHAKGRVIIFPQLSSHYFWQHSTCARNTVMEKILLRIRRKASPSMPSHYFFSARLPRQCQVIIFFRPDWLGNAESLFFFGPDQLARAESFIFSPSRKINNDSRKTMTRDALVHDPSSGVGVSGTGVLFPAGLGVGGTAKTAGVITSGRHR